MSVGCSIGSIAIALLLETTPYYNGIIIWARRRLLAFILKPEYYSTKPIDRDGWEKRHTYISKQLAIPVRYPLKLVKHAS